MVTPTQMLLRFQVSAVVNGVATFATATANPECRLSSRSQTSQIFRWQHRIFTRPPAPPWSPFNSHRNAASPKRASGLHFRYRRLKSRIPRVVTITDEPTLSRIHEFASAAKIAVQLSSKCGIGKPLQCHWQQVEFGAMRLLLSSIRWYRSSSRYQVTPHRSSCPCLVSFFVGHYDVLVSTPDSMFSVV